MDAVVKKIAMGVSNQRMTNTVGNTVPQRLSIELLQQSRQMWNGLFTGAIVKTTHSVDFLLISEHSVVFNCACDARVYVDLHISESLTMLSTSEMRDIIIFNDGR